MKKHQWGKQFKGTIFEDLLLYAIEMKQIIEDKKKREKKGNEECFFLKCVKKAHRDLYGPRIMYVIICPLSYSLKINQSSIGSP